MPRHLPLLAASLCLAFSSIAFAKTQPDEQIVYKKTPQGELKLHVFYPDGKRPTADAAPRPGIVFFFGGGWKGGSPGQFYEHCKYLASRGMVAMSAEYRTSGKHKTTPQECLKDAKSAVQWIRSHAKELGIDPDRLAAGGGSAGGHLAAALGCVAGFDEPGEDTSVSSKPCALVLFNPVFDNGPDGYGYDRVKDYWREFSPMHNLDKTTPPTIVFFGTEDAHVTPATAEAYRDKLKELGVRCDLHLYEGQKHGFFNYRGGKNVYYAKTVEAMDRFLESLGLLQGEPTVDKKKGA